METDLLRFDSYTDDTAAMTDAEEILAKRAELEAQGNAERDAAREKSLARFAERLRSPDYAVSLSDIDLTPEWSQVAQVEPPKPALRRVA